MDGCSCETLEGTWLEPASTMSVWFPASVVNPATEQSSVYFFAVNLSKAVLQDDGAVNWKCPSEACEHQSQGEEEGQVCPERSAALQFGRGRLR